MHLLVPFDDSDTARYALREACRMATPLDCVIALATVIVPARMPVDALPGAIWKETCRAERHLHQARACAERSAHLGADLRGVRVQARSWTDAVLAGAAHYAADAIVLAEWATPRGRLATLFGRTHAIVRAAPCDVRVVFIAGEPAGAQERGIQRQATAGAVQAAQRHV